jgi:hypothetical protein
LSGNNLKYPNISDFLPSNIETIKMNNISNGQPVSLFDFNRILFPKLKELSFEGNSLCGPYPASWKKSGLSVNLKNHSKTLWCSPSVNPDACGKLIL